MLHPNGLQCLYFPESQKAPGRDGHILLKAPMVKDAGLKASRNSAEGENDQRWMLFVNYVHRQKVHKDA